MVAAERRPLTADEQARIHALARARNEGTFYDVLGLRASASTEEIEAAYYETARQWHPDRFYARDTGELATTIEENFVTATRAYRTLKDPLKRQAYHRDIGLEGRVVVERPTILERPVVDAKDISPTVQAGVTSPGGTPVYEAVRIQPKPKPPPPAPPPPPPPKPKAPPAVDRIRQQISEQLARARQYYAAGKQDYDAGRFAKAEGALYLARQFDPKNAEYVALHEQASARAREGKAKGFIAQGEQEESYQRVKEAIAAYTKAVECDPPEGRAYYRLGMLLKRADQQQDERAALAWFRKAVAKEPQNATYRMALAEMYEGLGLAQNALREATATLAADPRNEPAKAMLKRLKR